jgi:hypothetical protein
MVLGRIARQYVQNAPFLAIELRLAEVRSKRYDREKALRIFVAAVHDEPRYVRACIEHAFETWRSRTNQ